MKRITVAFLLLISFLLTACQADQVQVAGTGDFCPLDDLPFPRPEPDYTGKLELDLTPFAGALEAYTSEQVSEKTNLIYGKNIPELQSFMDNGQLSAVELVVFYLDRIQRYDQDRLNSVLELNPEALEIAQALDDERLAGKSRGPMHGIPVFSKIILPPATSCIPLRVPQPCWIGILRGMLSL